MSERFDIQRTPWGDDIEQALAPIFRADDTGGVANVRRQVEQGAASAFRVSAGARLVGYYVVRIDATAGGDELVVVAGAGACPGRWLLRVMLPAIEAQAELSGCRWVRIHTSRPGLARRLPGHGYAPLEVVFRKELA